MKARQLFPVVLIGVPVGVQAQFGDPIALFARADADRDGVITRAEFLAERARSFDRLDKDGNGGLSEQEALAMGKGQRARVAIRFGFSRFDLDGDGQLSRAELAAGPTPAFDRADQNRDGAINQAEMVQARRQVW